MGLCNAPDIFQEKMSKLMVGLEFARVHIDDLLILSKGLFAEHISNLEAVFTRLQEAGLKINASKSSFGSHALEYLGYWITRKGICPVSKKVQAITKLEAPKTRRQLRHFIGLVNHY